MSKLCKNLLVLLAVMFVLTGCSKKKKDAAAVPAGNEAAVEQASAEQLPVVAAPAEKTAAENLLSVLPDDVIGFAATSGGDNLKSAFEKSIMGRMWNDPQMQSFYQAILSQVQAKIKQEADKTDRSDVVDTIKNFITLVMRRPIIIGTARKQDAEGPPLYGFVILDAAGHKDEIAAGLVKLEALADKGDINDVTIGSYQMHGPASPGPVTGYWGWAGNYLVVAINEKTGLALRYLQKPRTTEPDYLEGVSPGSDALVIYVEPQKLMDLGKAVAAMEHKEDKFASVTSMIDKLGLAGIGKAVVSIGFAGSDLVGRKFVQVPQPRTGIFANFKSIDMKMFDMVDSRAVSAFALSCDTAGLYDTIFSAIEASAPKDTYEEIQKNIAKFESQAQLSIRNGLLESLAGPVVCYFLPSGFSVEMPRGGFVVIAAAKDGAQFEKTMVAIGKFAADSSKGAVQVSSQSVSDGRTLHSCVIAPLAVAQIMPCWTIVNNYIVIASNPSLSNMAVSCVTSAQNAAASIRTTEGFKEAAAKLPENMVFFRYCDSKAQFRQLMVGLQSVWPMATMFATKAQINLPAILPTFSGIVEDMGPSCQYSWFDAEGLHSQYKGPGIETSVGSVAGASVGLGVLMPALSHARGQAKQVVSMSNLKQLGLSLALYAEDNHDNFPASLEQLKLYYRDSKILESPLKPAGFDGPSYIYIPGHSANTNDASKFIIIYENPEYCKDKINAVFLDSHVEAMQPNRFMEALRATYELLGREMPEIKFKD